MSVVNSKATLIAIVQDYDRVKNPGGTQIKERLLYQAIKELGIPAIFTSRGNIFRDLEGHETSRVIVFIQTNGRLSASYKVWADSLLIRGCEIVEVNIFALASRYRPVHSNYTLALMSMDGAYRYAFRSFWAGFTKVPSYLLLPNPEFFEPNRNAKNSKASKRYSFLRIGRPDPIKWSNFECKFLQKLAQENPAVEFKLSLLQPPETLVTSSNLPNLTIESLPYQANVRDLYADADFYIHHSAIGETFGNTIGEAIRSGVTVIYAADLDWDQAPVLRFSEPQLIWATRKKLMKNAQAVFHKLVQTGDNGSFFTERKHELSSYVNRLLEVDKSRIVENTPKPYEFVSHLLRLRSEATFKLSLLAVSQGVILEILRAIKNRWIIDP
jgi:glycosyltransferase involved in cell wall biosynthesis